MSRGTGRTTRQIFDSLTLYDKFTYVVPNPRHVEYCRILIQKYDLPQNRIRIVTSQWVNGMQFMGLREQIVIDHSIWDSHMEITLRALQEIQAHNSRWGCGDDLR